MALNTDTSGSRRARIRIGRLGGGWRRLGIVAASALSIVLVTAGIAIATIPGPGGTISGCYDNANGALRVIDSTANCVSGETALTWSQTGPAGPAGVTGYAVVTGVASASSSSTAKTASVTCASGKVVLGGGGIISGGTSTSPIAVVQSFASSDGRTWTVKAIELRTYSGSWSLQARAECALHS